MRGEGSMCVCAFSRLVDPHGYHAYEASSALLARYVPPFHPSRSEFVEYLPYSASSFIRMETHHNLELCLSTRLEVLILFSEKIPEPQPILASLQYPIVTFGTSWGYFLQLTPL